MVASSRLFFIFISPTFYYKDGDRRTPIQLSIIDNLIPKSQARQRTILTFFNGRIFHCNTTRSERILDATCACDFGSSHDEL